MGKMTGYFANNFKCITLNENIWISNKISLITRAIIDNKFSHWFKLLRFWIGVGPLPLPISDPVPYAISHHLQYKGFESIGYWTHHVTLNYDLDPWMFQGQILKKPYLRNGRANWHGMKGMWVDGMSHPLCVIEHWPWPWPWIFKVEFWNSCYSKMGRPIGIEWKGLKSRGSWTNYVTLNFDLTHDLDLVF